MVSNLAELADEIERHLLLDVADAWFPRCIDPKGGYHENHSREWRLAPDLSRTLVFQSRVLWFTAKMSERDPAFHAYGKHGLDYFNDCIIDERGMVKNSFRPFAGIDLSKHRSSYSLAFAVYGMAAAAKHLKSSQALAHASTIFNYLEAHHKDVHGRGYFERTDLDGNVNPELPRKGQNSHLHLLEAFAELYRVWPLPLVKKRIQELIDFMTDDLFVEPGYLDDFIQTDGERGDGRINFGHDLEVAHLLVTAADVIGEDQPLVRQRAIQLTDHALLKGWDVLQGGFWSGKTPEGTLERVKVWWVQCEALLGLAQLFSLTGKSAYLDALFRQWSWIRDHQIDSEFRGFYGVVDEHGQPIGRMAKGHTWKACYHDGRALMRVPEILRGISR